MALEQIERVLVPALEHPGPSPVQRLVKILRLNLKGCYFDAIKADKKVTEFRLAEKWLPHLLGRDFDEIHLLRGYPKATDYERILRRRWNGYVLTRITHEHFGPEPVDVVAIDVSQKL